MDIKEIQEREEWPLRLGTIGEPAEELAIDHRRRLANSRVEQADQVGKEDDRQRAP